MFQPLKQFLPDINFFVQLHDHRTSHEDEILFWDQRKNQLQKYSKIPGLSHQDHDHRSLNFQSFHLNLDFNFSDLITSYIRTYFVA
jgi:hypothetical protein